MSQTILVSNENDAVRASPHPTALNYLDKFQDPQTYESKSENSLGKEFFTCKGKDIWKAVEKNMSEKFEIRERNLIPTLIDKDW